MMNWDAIGAIGELVGSLAVVITLVYLTVQTKINTKAVRSSSTNQSRAALVDVMSIIASDSEAATIYHTGMTDRASLDAIQRLRFDTFIFLTLRTTEAMFWDHRDELLSDALWQGQWSGQHLVLVTKGGLESWHRQQNLLSSEFKDWVNVQLNAS